MTEEEALEEVRKLICELPLYMDRGLYGGVAWRLADALYWLKVGIGQKSQAYGGIGEPTGLGNILKNVYGS